jgi:hypothetical protein
VQIHGKEAPYREKVVIRRSGTKEKPIIIRGVPDSQGRLPVLDGDRAKNFQKLCEPNKVARGLLILGDCSPADNILIQGLKLKNANNKNRFFLGNQLIPYADNAAGIFVNKGDNVRIKKCVINSCCMGIMTSHYPHVGDFTLSSSFIHENGDFSGKGWGHGVYLCARRTVIEFNRFGDLCSDGNVIKDRSQTAVIRYNWIEGGMSHQIDLVEDNQNSYKNANAYVYGNVILQGHKVRNPKMILFGGDVGGSRQGILYFFNNTVYGKTRTPRAFVFVNKPDCSALLQNNVMLGGKNIWMGSGSVSGSNNLFSHGAHTEGIVNSFYGGVEQFVRHGPIPYLPKPGALLINTGTFRIPAKVKYMPAPFTGGTRRPVKGTIDIGAFEWIPKKRKKK